LIPRRRLVTRSIYVAPKVSPFYRPTSKFFLCYRRRSCHDDTLYRRMCPDNSRISSSHEPFSRRPSLPRTVHRVAELGENQIFPFRLGSVLFRAISKDSINGDEAARVGTAISVAAIDRHVDAFQPVTKCSRTRNNVNLRFRRYSANVDAAPWRVHGDALFLACPVLPHRHRGREGNPQTKAIGRAGLKNPKEFLGRVRWNLWTALNSELPLARIRLHRHLAEFPSRPAETSRKREKRGRRRGKKSIAVQGPHLNVNIGAIAPIPIVPSTRVNSSMTED